MPLVFPHPTLGGPAAGRSATFSTWWNVTAENEYLQVQSHKATMGSFFTSKGIEKMRESRSAKGDRNTDPYRIIVKGSEPYPCIATSSDYNEILADFYELEQVLVPKILIWCDKCGSREDLTIKVVQWTIAAVIYRDMEPLLSDFEDSEGTNNLFSPYESTMILHSFPIDRLTSLVSSLAVLKQLSPTELVAYVRLGA